MKLYQLAIYCLFLATSTLSAQQFLRPFDGISRGKTSYITLEDGTEMEGLVKKLKRKKGLIKEITIQVEGGDKQTIAIEKIKHAYLPQSGFDKLNQTSEFLYDIPQWDRGMHDQERLKDGYAFFEKAEVQVKKKKMILLMQLLNPGVCSRLKVYHDPFAAETASLGVGAFTMVGGEDKSFYVQKDGGLTVKVAKKKYRNAFSDLFTDCGVVKGKYKDASWKQFEETVFTYNTECTK